MLEPDNRSALTDLLRPPRGWRLEHAVGTTFTLDLHAALRVPMSLAAHGEDGDDLGVLSAIARAADRVDVFAQAGAMSFGHPRTDLVVFLEPMVHPVTTRPGGLFHPKVWFLEFSRGEERSYRFLCASRNLTFDRCWDAVVRLDGLPTPDPAAAGRNAPLTGLLRALPALAVDPLPRARRTAITALADRFSRVDWELPDGVWELGFEVWGIGQDPEPQFRGRRMLVVSPFVTEGGLRTLNAHRRPTDLVSRAESIDQLPASILGPKLRLNTFDVASDPGTQEPAEGPAGSAETQLSGLHAKLTVAEHGQSAYARIGSQNATDAAFSRNVEAMVMLRGRIGTLGIDVTLEGLGDLLVDHEPQGPTDPDPDEELDRLLTGALTRVGGTPVRMRVQPSAGDRFRLGVSTETIEVQPQPAGVRIDWALVSSPGLTQAWPPGPPRSPSLLEDVELADITPFLLLTATAEGRSRSTVVLARLEGDPAGRQEAVISKRLSDPMAFQRFIALLLELEHFGDAAPGSAWGAGGTGAGLLDADGIFEPLMQAVADGHAGLADVDRLVRHLRQASSDVLPEGFESLWAQLWQAHRGLTVGGRR